MQKTNQTLMRNNRSRMVKRTVCLILFIILSLIQLLVGRAGAVGTRGIMVTALEKSSGEKKEVKLYNKSYAVIIGIDYLNRPNDRLTYAVRDAKGVENTLKKHFKFDQVISLYDQQATRDRILELLLGRMSKLDSEDALFIFFAGHGVTEKTRFGDLGYLVPFDGEIKQADKYYKNISMSQIRDEICKKGPKHIFFVADACYSGLLVDKRGTGKRKTLRSYEYLKELAKEPVCQVLTAGSKDQKVLDGGPKGHSVFTGRLIEALEGVEDFITASELSQRVKERVYADANARNHVQTPKDGELFGLGDFIFVPAVEKSGHEMPPHPMAMYQPKRIDGCEDYHCGHEHGAVFCHGGALFYLRSSRGTGYSDCYERATSVAEKLNNAMQIADSEFKLKWDGDTPTIWHIRNDGSEIEKIVTITSGDVMGYERRAEIFPDKSLKRKLFDPQRKVRGKTAGKIVVAEWWLALLTDHFKLMVKSEKPTETINTYYGEVLYEMWKRAKKDDSFNMPTWNKIVKGLSAQDRKKLHEAARIIPEDFFDNWKIWRKYMLN